MNFEQKKNKIHFQIFKEKPIVEHIFSKIFPVQHSFDFSITKRTSSLSKILHSIRFLA